MEGKKKSKFETFLKIFSVIFFIVAVTLLVFAQINNPDLGVGRVILFGFLIFAVALGMFFTTWFIGKFKHEKKLQIEQESEKIPAPADMNQLRKLRNQLMMNEDYFSYEAKKENGDLGIIEQGLTPIGEKGMLIYSYIYEDQWTAQTMAVLINAHYPTDRYKILVNPTNRQIERNKLILAGSEDKSVIFETEDEDPLTGRTHRTIKKTPYGSKKDKEKKQGDLE